MRYVVERFAEALEIIVRPDRYVYLDSELLRDLRELLAYYERCELQDRSHLADLRSLVKDMVRFAIHYQWTSLENMKIWQSLTPRQKDVVACICLGYTNVEIASKLMISFSTVKTHIRNVLEKFNVSGKLELKEMLRDWDFSKWVFGNNSEI